jgi:hypothetical protein
MKIITLCLLMLTTSPALAQEAHINWQLAYSPPGGDIVAGGKIARYVLEVEQVVRYKYVQLSVLAQGYGVTDWVTKETRGHGMDKFKGSYAWAVDSWRFAVTPRLEVGTEKINFFIENYAPIDRHGVWSDGHGQATEYYWLLGVSGRIDF